MGKLELVTKFKMEQENEHLQAYKRVFPQARPTIFQMEMIEAYVTDAKAWRKTLEFWGLNDYRPQSIGKMLDYYRQVIAGTVQTFEDKTKVQIRVGAEQAPVQAKCGKCLDSGSIRIDDPSAQFGIRFEECTCKLSEAA